MKFNNLFVINLNEIEKETISRYNEIAKKYDSGPKSRPDKSQLNHLERFEELIGLPQKRVLDAGCGAGRDSVYFASRGYSTWGIDLSVGMLGRAKEKAKSKNLKIDFSVQDMRKLNFPDNYFDGLWNMASLVHLSPIDKKKTIEEFYRVLKPSGILHIWAQNLLTPKRFIRLFQSHLRYFLSSKENWFTKIKVLGERTKIGYAYLDHRHWFFATKFFIIKTLKMTNFSILETNSIFSRRLSIYAKKLV